MDNAWLNIPDGFEMIQSILDGEIIVQTTRAL